MKWLSAMLLSVTSIYAHCQSPVLITGSGDIFENGHVELEWSLGEILVEAYSNSEYELMQGVHQPQYNVVSATDESSEVNFEVSAYPNPTSDLLEVRTSARPFQRLMYELIDLQGKVRYSKSLSGTSNRIDMSGFSQNLYLLKVIDEEGRTISSFKVQKIN